MLICIFVEGRQMIVRQEEGAKPALPEYDEICSLLPTNAKPLPVHAEGIDLLAVEIAEWTDSGHYVLRDFRSLFTEMEAAIFAAAVKAKQIVFWDSHSRFCPACGTPTGKLDDIAKKCPACGYEIYPNISPAIIVRVEKGDDEILMVRAKNFRDDHYGLVAGFVEAGETIEECVRREVMEETGLEISEPKYVGSQPWPFPSGLMLGFVAKYVSGEIKIQEEELVDARFFRRDSMPTLPGKMSIAYRLVKEWLNK